MKYNFILRNLKQRNFFSALTMVEVTISIAILGFLTLSIFSVLNVGDMTWRSEMSLVEVQQNARLSLDGMIREIRQSKTTDITISNGGAQIDFYVSGVSNAIRYSLDSSSRIIREHPAGTTKILARDINSLLFSLSGGVVTIQVSGTKTSIGRTQSFQLNEKVKLRNG